jgi:hypothetical protein
LHHAPHRHDAADRNHGRPDRNLSLYRSGVTNTTKKRFQARADAVKDHKAQIDTATFRWLVKDIANVQAGAFAPSGKRHMGRNTLNKRDRMSPN